MANATTMTTLIAYTIANTTLSDWDLVVACLSTSGDFRDAFSPREQGRIRELADGFGNVRSLPAHQRFDLVWDWSHVRDSSDEAVTKMAGVIKAKAARFLLQDTIRQAEGE